MLPDEPESVEGASSTQPDGEAQDARPLPEEPPCDPAGDCAEAEGGVPDTISLASLEVVDGPQATDELNDAGGSGIVTFASTEAKPRARKGKAAPAAGGDIEMFLATEAGDVVEALGAAGADADSSETGQMASGSAPTRETGPGEPEGAQEESEVEGAGDEIPAGAPAGTIDSARARQLVEAVLFTAPGALSGAKLAAVLPGLTAADVRKAVDDLNDAYRAGGHAFLVEEIAGGFRLLTRSELGETLGAFFMRRSKERLSRAALETLAIVAYKQPATRSTIETIRGVVSDSVVANLMELGLVRISGQAEAPGRPMLYSTTKRFLDHFGLKSLRDLPREKDFDAMEKA